MLKKLLLNERAVLAIILLNTAIIFAQECGAKHPLLDMLDMLCTLIFLIEAAVKIAHHGWRRYWSDRWNRLDFIIVVLSIPSLLELLLPNSLSGLETLQVLRTLRILKSFRTFRLFPDFSSIVRHFFGALRKTVGILCSFTLLIVIAALLCTSLLREIAPQHFGSVGTSAYTIFRLCTIEGWYEIPESIAAATSPLWGSVARVVFSLMLVLGGIIGMSLINSIFVDEMVSDNDNDIKQQLSRLEDQLADLSRMMVNTATAQRQQPQAVTHNHIYTTESTQQVVNSTKTAQQQGIGIDEVLQKHISNIANNLFTILSIATSPTKQTELVKHLNRIESKQAEFRNNIDNAIDAANSLLQHGKCKLNVEKQFSRMDIRFSTLQNIIKEDIKAAQNEPYNDDLQKQLGRIKKNLKEIKNKYDTFLQILMKASKK